ncbi:hypothetical protein EJB05_21959 [Eragrostis curvula]|uniref:Uncharacterized protein n=1 Tax=Eragrostis curvula TaxID=38414 RepID=A0A5J9V2Y0_9POAL|nr:hypothetical protein EJB05_21959 [Eragrostis curvula]
MAAAAAGVALLLLPPLGQAEERPTKALSSAPYDFFHPSARRERARQAHGNRIPFGLCLCPSRARRLSHTRRQQQLRESVVKGASTSVARADQEEGGVAPGSTARRGAFRAGRLAGVIAGAAATLVALGAAYTVARRRVARSEGVVRFRPAQDQTSVRPPIH